MAHSRPQVLLQLQYRFAGSRIGGDGARVVMDYLRDVEMGFELANVTVTSHRVLSLLASLVIGSVFAFGDRISESLFS